MNLKNKVIGLIATFTTSMCLATTYQLSTHILDINQGMPASSVSIELYKFNDNNGNWIQISKSITDENGRVKELLPIEGGKSNKGIYKLKFQVKEYFDRLNAKSFYPFIEVSFELSDDAHYHVPITLSPYGYSTYRGS